MAISLNRNPEINRKTFTVLMSVYNKADPKLFKKAIHSIYKNTLLPDRVLIVLDGPLNQNLKEILEHLKEKYKFESLALDKNVGLAKALNFGLSKVSTDYVVRADADDINLSCRFKMLSNLMNENYDLAGSFIEEYDDNQLHKRIKKVPITKKNIEKYISYRNPFNHMTICFKTKLVKEVGGYPIVDLKEDYALWIKLFSKNLKVKNIDKVLVRVSAGNDMFERRRGLKSVISEIEIQKLLLENKLSNPLKSLMVFCFRSAILILPSKLIKFFYLSFLRNK
tara:strand:+ start:255 stop:1097 length:843 start_codon:yes stop_codon:yes gene_type:complete